MKIIPCTITAARAFVRLHHRHHKPPVSGLFALALALEDEVVGVAIVGRPVARALDDGFTCEVTRVAILEGHKNGCSMICSAAWRAARALGYTKMITYTLESENGASLRGAGWTESGKVRGRQWSCPSRPREASETVENKRRWMIESK